MQVDTDRPIDEVFDVQKDVEQNPCGALMAIHSLHATVIEQQAEIERLRTKMLELLTMLDYDKISDRYRIAIDAAYEEFGQ